MILFQNNFSSVADDDDGSWETIVRILNIKSQENAAVAVVATVVSIVVVTVIVAVVVDVFAAIVVVVDVLAATITIDVLAATVVDVLAAGVVVVDTATVITVVVASAATVVVYAVVVGAADDYVMCFRLFFLADGDTLQNIGNIATYV